MFPHDGHVKNVPGSQMIMNINLKYSNDMESYDSKGNVIHIALSFHMVL